MTPILGVAWATCARAFMPAESVDYTVDVDGPLAEVTVEQVFVNESGRALEAVYVFPLHEDAAVDGMHIEVAGQVVVGRIQTLELAEADYVEALAEGRVAALTTQQRPNVFTQRVGNIPPGERVTVRLSVVQPVPRVDGAYELVIPLVVAPRFVSSKDWETAGWSPHERPFEHPPVAVRGTSLTAGLDVEIDSGLPFRWFESPSHEVSLSILGERSRAITTRVPMDRDFVLRWSVRGDRPLAAMHVMDGHAIVTLEPPEAPPREHIVPRELIWVVDRSGSMSGAPIELVREAMLAALDQVDGRDSLRILRFAERVDGDAHSRAATPSVVAQARAEIRALTTGGGTYLLEGVLAALDTPRDPARERMVVFMTDGLISNDTRVLAAIADRVGDARLFAFGVGAAPNRWLLDEMARFGGGRSTWLRDGESPSASVDRFLDTLSRPVLTDIEIDWGDWEVSEVWPRRLPALHAGQPLLISTRITRRGTTPVVVRGRLGDGAYHAVIEPEEAEPGRAIPSTWARQKIANLERDQVWGEVPDLADEILATSLAYQVLSQRTAFLAVDSRRRVQPEGPWDDPQLASADASEDILLEARAQAIDVRSTTHATVLSRDFLTRVPSGRSYQTAVGMAAGATGGGGNPNLGGAAYNESAYLLDGATITDPVTGTFSVNFNVDVLEQIEVLPVGIPAEYPGAAAPLVNAVSRSGTNTLMADLSVHRMARVDARREPLVADGASATLSGPLIRDRMWLIGSYGFERSHLGSQELEEHKGFAKLSVQPTTEHRVSVTGSRDAALVRDGDADAAGAQSGGLAVARWQWFLSPATNLDVTASGQGGTVLGDQRERQDILATMTAHSLGDPLGGEHDIRIGAEADRSAWRIEGAWASAWLGVPVDPEASLVRGSWFVQDAWTARRDIVLDLGLRSDHTLGRAHLGPRFAVAWDPFSDQRIKLAVGATRAYGHLGLPTLAIEPEAGLSLRDEVMALAEAEVVEDLALGVVAAYDIHSGLPVHGGGRADLRHWYAESFLRKVWSRRWTAQATWRFSEILGKSDPARVLIDDGSLPGFAHTASASATWDLPTDPWTQSIGLTGTLGAEPLGTLVPDGSTGAQPNLAGWTGGVQVVQRIDLRRGRLELHLSGRVVALFPDGRDLSRFVVIQAPVLQQPGWEGPRVEGGVGYAF